MLVSAQTRQAREGTRAVEPAGKVKIVSGRSGGRCWAVLMTSSGQLSGRADHDCHPTRNRYSTRSGAQMRAEFQRPPLSSMPVEYLTPAIEDRAVELLRLLADRASIVLLRYRI